VSGALLPVAAGHGIGLPSGGPHGRPEEQGRKQTHPSGEYPAWSDRRLERAAHLDEEEHTAWGGRAQRAKATGLQAGAVAPIWYLNLKRVS
jgi:hypothetical protein